MNVVRVVCLGDCGQVLVARENFTLYVCAEDPSLCHYTFLCPNCGEVGTRPAGEFAIAALLAGGIRPVAYSPPRELRERQVAELSSRDLPPITEDDLIDFMVEIERYNRGERTLTERSK